MTAPTDLEQLLLEYVNETRLDPVGSASRYISSYDPLRSSDPNIQSALTYFGVGGAALKSAFGALTPVQPLAWNDALAQASRAHDQVMIDTQSQTHQASGEAGLGDRDTAAGYTNWNRLGENVYAYSYSPLYAHAGFMVDWGPGTDGMQSPAGHRVNLMNGAYTEIGIGILLENDPNTPTGPQVVTQDLGSRANTPGFVLGVAYSDRDGNAFYSAGEGRGDLTVAMGGGSVTSYATGGYSLARSGDQPVMLTGGGLGGAVFVQLAHGITNVKLDVVDGTLLKASGSVSVSGAVTTVQGLGVGVSITVDNDHGYAEIGTGGDDTLTGGSGGDAISGGAGSDWIVGGAGNDHLYGQSVTGGSDGADTIQGGAGGDYIQGNAGNDVLDGGADDDRINGGAGDDLISGGSGNDTINGNLGNDMIGGGDGDDVLRGGQGDDRIDGGAGNDVVNGDLGNDTLTGGAGIDLLTGGGGADVFSFAGGDAAFSLGGALAGYTDAITDFTGGMDRIALGFTPAAVVVGAQAQASLASALDYAQGILSGDTVGREVIAVHVGNDSYLFFGAGGGTAIDSAIKIIGVDAGAFGTADFL